MYLSAERQHATVNLVIEWFAELTRLVPATGLERSTRAFVAI